MHAECPRQERNAAICRHAPAGSMTRAGMSCRIGDRSPMPSRGGAAPRLAAAQRRSPRAVPYRLLSRA